MTLYELDKPGGLRRVGDGFFRKFSESVPRASPGLGGLWGPLGGLWGASGGPLGAPWGPPWAPGAPLRCGGCAKRSLRLYLSSFRNARYMTLYRFWCRRGCQISSALWRVRSPAPPPWHRAQAILQRHYVCTNCTPNRENREIGPAAQGGPGGPPGGPQGPPEGPPEAPQRPPEAPEAPRGPGHRFWTFLEKPVFPTFSAGPLRRPPDPSSGLRRPPPAAYGGLPEAYRGRPRPAREVGACMG